jgi:Arginosuccinate synthase C-terminal domain
LFQGQARAVARTSPQTLYRPQLASFDMHGYDAQHAEGFIRLFGLPLASAARRGRGEAASADAAPEDATVAQGAKGANGANATRLTSVTPEPAPAVQDAH